MDLWILVFTINMPGTADENLPVWLNLAHLHDAHDDVLMLINVHRPFWNVQTPDVQSL